VYHCFWAIKKKLEGTVPSTFDVKLEKYADLIVQVALNLRAGQKLCILSPIQGAPLVRKIAASAYRAGARLVDVIWGDEEVTLARFQNAPRDSFEEFPAWQISVPIEYMQDGNAMLNLHAQNPDLLKDQDPEIVGTAIQTAQKYRKPLLELITRNAGNWIVISMPIPSWAAKVFPDLPEEQREKELWNAIFEVCRLNEEDPVAVWKSHVRGLTERAGYLTGKQYTALKITSPGTDLTVGLPSGHVWMGGELYAQNGITFIPNMPTEEVFTMPHKDRVDGKVTATRPLVFGGKLIENFSLTFQGGQVVEFHAEKGEEALRQLLDTDEGARRLGEVALVPYSSPVSKSGILFFNTLFDENAASHLALGKAYRFTMQHGAEKTEEEFQAAGGNHSLTHDDFMIGSQQTNVDGVCPDGNTEPLMRMGEWVIGH